MDLRRLDEFISALPSRKIAIAGDFFLDQYMVIDPELVEKSIETGLDAHQVVEMRPSPGAAGSVTTKVAALGTGIIYAVTILGDDGNGYELSRELKSIGVRFDHVLLRADRFTPTYGKPMIRRAKGSEEEINRIDVKNRQPVPEDAEAAIIRSLRQLAAEVDAIIVLDQVEQPNCGVITDAVREELCRIAAEHPKLIVFADSRNRIGLFRDIMVKPNFKEASRALGRGGAKESLDAAKQMAGELAAANRRPVFLTVGAKGIITAGAAAAEPAAAATVVPALPVRGPIDTTGAGDTVTAGVVCALSAGANAIEAAEMGNLAASVTIRQLGTTGTATPEQMRAALREFAS